MDSSSFHALLQKKFPHQPTLKQEVVLNKLAEFLLSDKKDILFLLKGYAGTGKTTMISTIVTNLWNAKLKAVLLAPTGRAAKVITSYSNSKAYTIHKKIYFPKKEANGGVSFQLQQNKHRNTIFIVDEASMIPDIPADSKLFENGSLLDDLMMYVYSGHNCKLLLIGDTAQLPPVKLELSPALDADKMSLSFNKDVTQIEMDEVVRQQQDSGILFNATLLREQLASSFFEEFRFNISGFSDIVRLIEGNEIMDAINYGFKFAEVNVRMVDYPNQKPFETVLLLDTISAESASLSYEESNRLYQEVMEDYADAGSKYRQFLKVKKNKYFNALQVKFSYAITCHKSQGGQWSTVFVEQPYLPNGVDREYLRWLYTAVTRATDKLYLLGFKNEFFEDDV